MTKREFKGKYVTLWPQYFDSTLPRSLGRRVPKELAVPNPKTEEIVKVLNVLGRNYLLPDEELRYPRAWWKREGPVYVEKKEGESKQKIIFMVARALKEKRSKRF